MNECTRTQAGSRWALAFVVALCAAGVLAAGRRWPPGAQIKVWIGASAERSDGPALVERAMKTWNTAGAGRFTLTRSTDERTAGIRVTFVRGDTFLGEAAPVTDVTTGYIRDADVAIASNITADPLTQRVIIYLTALHELGHALGLPHSAEFADIMYLFREPDDAERYFGAYRRKLRSEKDIGSVKATGLSPHDLQVFDAVYSG